MQLLKKKNTTDFLLILSQLNIAYLINVRPIICLFILFKVCSADLVEQTNQIGGPGHIVSIDESLVARRKPGNPQGRPVPEQWVFGGIDHQTK